MTPEEYERIREIFLAARVKERGEQEDFLRRECGVDEAIRAEVESLLASEQKAQTFLQSPALGEDFAVRGPEALASGAGLGEEGVDPVAGDARPISRPARIGQYKTLSVLGEGGMGIVYRAEQENPQRTVALKVIKPGVQSREAFKRFEQETRVLALLQHPGIAQIFEAGTADAGQGPQPFFAMEFVEGQTITAYAHARRLDVRGRLELMAKVSDAVHHAHQRGVIHRDLKPGNILVDAAGQPKVLDFGVARATDADTRMTTLQTSAGQIIGTLAYMSPEQISGDSRELDTCSDVYSLGVICYELLTGRLPLDLSKKTIPQAALAVAEDEPDALGSVNKVFRGDIEAIVAKAMEKDKERRYQSASAFSADIRCLLADQPVSARQITTMYQLRKFARRNKPLVAGVVAAFVALLIGIIGTTSQAVRATRQRDRAVRAEELAGQRLARIQAEADKVKAINRFFNDMLVSVDPARGGRDLRVADVLDRAAQNVEEELADQGEIRAAIQNTIGTVYVGLGMYPQAERYLRAALEARRELLGEESQDTLVTMTNLAGVLKETNRLDEAESLVRRTLALRRSELGPDNVRTLDAMNNLAEVLQRQGRVVEAEALWREVLAGQRRILEPDNPLLLVTMNNLAQLLKQLRKPAQAEPLLREALELLLKANGEEHPHTLKCMSNLAATLRSQGKYEEAEPLLRRVVEIRRRTLGDHPSVFLAVNNLARLLQDAGRPEEAEPLAGETLEGLRRTLGSDNRMTLIALSNLASLLVELDRASEAEALCLEAIETAGRTLPEGHWMTLIFERGYGRCLTVLGRYEEAESHLLPAYEGLAASLGDEHEHTYKTLETVVQLYESWGKQDQADQYRAKLGD